MFRENEPGKPKNWNRTITVIAVTTLINISIFVVCRILLDSEDSNDEPLLQGEIRDKLTYFLGIFSMTLCFGCCCCFCCGCEIFRWLSIFNCCHFDLSRLWSRAIKNKYTNASNLRQVRISSIPRIHIIPNEREQFFYANPSFDASVQEPETFFLQEPFSRIAENSVIRNI